MPNLIVIYMNLLLYLSLLILLSAAQLVAIYSIKVSIKVIHLSLLNLPTLHTSFIMCQSAVAYLGCRQKS